MTAMRKRHHASWRGRQRKQGPRPPITGGDTCRSWLPRPDVQVSGACIAKCRQEWLTAQPPTQVHSLICATPGKMLLGPKETQDP